MTPETWTSVDRYFEKLLPQDPILEAALTASNAAGLPPIAVAPNQGRMLQLIAQMQHARRILEIGTLGGYSTIWLARALPADGKLVTLEIDAKHADVARANFARAGLGDRIELRLGPASQSLRALIAEKAAPFDLIFIDADKVNSPDYFTCSLALSRPGTIIIVDNVARKGAVIAAESPDPAVIGMRRLTEMIAKESRVSSTAIQTVGVKGYDGFILARVN
jgi:predicted O-methyltransferase YrrM